MADSNKVTLQSSDGKIYNVDHAVASLSKFLTAAMDDGENESERVIIVENVSGKILGLVIDYCTYHVRVAPPAEADTVRIWDIDFMKPLVDHDKHSLIQLSKASDYLQIGGLLDLTCQSIADLIKGKHPETIRRMLNIHNDLPH